MGLFGRLLVSLYLLVCSPFNAAAQTPLAAGENLVPNAGFEQFAATPIGWFYKGEHFTRVMRDWQAATAASPDVFGPKVRVPSAWAEKDFGKQTPRAGRAMAGLTLYGCADGKPHCREYVQVRLREPLVPGQTYEVAAHVARLPRSLVIDRLGFLFTGYAFDEPTDVRIDEQPQVEIQQLMQVSPQQWLPLTGRFVAESPATHLTVGNFRTDANTRTARPAGDRSVGYAYYYLDDVVVRKVPPILDAPVLGTRSDDLEHVVWEVGSVVQLRNIFFDFDRAELLPRSSVELDKVLHLLRTHPGMVLEFSGHTDSRGDDAYNLDLSLRRARAVVDYLKARGIDAQRLRYRGAGSREPIAGNGTDAGRRLNRRVELAVVRMDGKPE